jgi:hypothetical protein
MKSQAVRSIRQMEVLQGMPKQEDSPDVISLVTRPVVGRSLPTGPNETEAHTS